MWDTGSKREEYLGKDVPFESPRAEGSRDDFALLLSLLGLLASVIFLGVFLANRKQKPPTAPTDHPMPTPQPEPQPEEEPQQEPSSEREPTPQAATPVITQAETGQTDAVSVLFRSFVGPNDKIESVHMLGTHGFGPFAATSYGCMTQSRICGLTVGPFGRVIYQDMPLSEITGTITYQPSLWGLVLLSLIWVVVSIMTFGIGLLFLPAITRAYYRVNKSGLVFLTRDSVPLYLFANRSQIDRAIDLSIQVQSLRPRR